MVTSENRFKIFRGVKMLGMLSEKINEILLKYDKTSDKFSESDISQEIEAVLKENDLPKCPLDCLAEAMAFDFNEYPNNDSCWGTYFGPSMVLTSTDGNIVEYPSIKRISEDMIEHLAERSKQSSHPILRARYAILVWDFTKITTGKTPHFSIAQIAIDSIVDVAQKNCHKFKIDVIRKLEHALSLSVSLNDNSRIAKVRDAIITYEELVAEDKKPGLWGFAYDLLWNNEKANLTDVQRQKLISDLESRLERVSQVGAPNFDPWSTESAAIRLANHYRRLDSPKDVKRVILKIGSAFEEEISKGNSPLRAYFLLQQVHATYIRYNLREDADEIAIKLREIGPQISKEMKEICHEIKISKEEMDSYLEKVLDGDIEDVLKRIAALYVPSKVKVEEQLDELSKKAPLYFIFTKHLQNHEGRTVANLDSIDNDQMGHIVHQMYQNMVFGSMFLRSVMSSLISKFSLTNKRIVDYLYQSPIFNEDRRRIIEIGVQSYLEGSYIVAIHLLVPQIEDAIRKLTQLSGGSILKQSRLGRFNLKILDELLREERILDAFGEDATLYFRVLLTDQRGWNVRNNTCHGLLPSEAFNAIIADRVIHVLFCLALVRERERQVE